MKHHQSKKLFEIGTYDGRTTANMAANCPADAEIRTIDLPRDMIDDTELPITSGERRFVDKETSGLRFSGTDWEKQIVQLYGDSAAFDFSPFYNTSDFVFVDGSHRYEYVLNDSRVAAELVGSGNGIIMWDDYGVWKGVSKALDELCFQANEYRDLRHIEGTSLVYLRITGEI